jgi:hypothetical protein
MAICLRKGRIADTEGEEFAFVRRAIRRCGSFGVVHSNKSWTERFWERSSKNHAGYHHNRRRGGR